MCSAARLSTPAPPEPLPHLYASANQLQPLDRFSGDSTLFQFTNRGLRDFIDPKHLLIQIDEQFDFLKFAEPVEDHHCRHSGRPAIHP